MDEFLNEFLTETNESRSVLDVELVKLEQDPEIPDQQRKIFRLMHTIKGTCGILGLSRREPAAHVGESVLGKVGEGAFEVIAEAGRLSIRNAWLWHETGPAEPLQLPPETLSARESRVSR